MPIALVNGQHIAYEDSGQDLPAVVFSHGFLMDKSMFSAQVSEFASDYRCICWDERGFGDTPAKESFSYWDSADDLMALLDSLGIEQAVLAGMSQGGFLSLRAALRYPKRVKALILIDSGVHVDPPEVLAGYSEMMQHWMSDEPLGEVGANVAGLILGDAELEKQWTKIWESRDRYSLKYPSEALLTRDDIGDRISEISCPVIMIHGEEDFAIPLESAEQLSPRFPDSRGLVKVPGAAHAANMTHPNIVNPAIATFLASIV